MFFKLLILFPAFVSEQCRLKAYNALLLLYQIARRHTDVFFAEGVELLERTAVTLDYQLFHRYAWLCRFEKNHIHPLLQHPFLYGHMKLFLKLFVKQTLAYVGHLYEFFYTFHIPVVAEYEMPEFGEPRNQRV